VNLAAVGWLGGWLGRRLGFRLGLFNDGDFVRIIACG